MDKFHVFVDMPMRDVTLKQRILCIICISIFRAFSAEKKVCIEREHLKFFVLNKTKV